MYTFVEQVGVRLEQLDFKYNGKIIPLDATPRSIGMNEDENLIYVSKAEAAAAASTTTAISISESRRLEFLTRLNRMAKVSVGVGPHQGGIFTTEILPSIMDFVDLETLVNMCQVCRHWFHVTQRFSVLL